MKNLSQSLLSGFFALLFLLLFTGSALAQDPTKVDSTHYKVVFENDQVRVLRITYGAGEKSVMHYHPDVVAVFTTDNKVNFTLPDGKVIETSSKKGDVVWTPAGEHLPQNVGDKSIEVILVEMKGARTNLQIVDGMYNSFAMGNIPAVLADMDPNVEWNESENFPYADGNPYIGPNAVMEGVFKRLGSEWEYWKLTDQVFYESKNDEIIVTGRYNAKHKKTGKGINAQFVHMWWFKNGKVVRFQQYADTEQVNNAMQ